MEVFASDNSGNRVVFDADTADPVAGSGQTLTDETTGGDHTVTVVAGATYAFTAALTGSFFFGIAAVTTAANIIWVCGLYNTIIMKIPLGVTTLHYAGSANGATGYLRKLA